MESANSIYVLARSLSGENKIFQGEINVHAVCDKEAIGGLGPNDSKALLSSLVPDGFYPMLVGGFPTIVPQGLGLPVSVALKLNGDISGLSHQGLVELGLVELSRINGQNYKSYTIEPDKRAAVLSRDAKALSRFIDVWGGVLEIIPLLLDGMHPGFTCVKDISIAVHQRSLRIAFQEPAPIDLEKCTLCGACSWVCPELCIAPGPFLDLTRCNRCAKCIEVCREGAIDLHASLQGTLEIPYIIVLEDLVDSGLPIEEASGLIFTESDIEGLISNLFPKLVEEVVNLDQDLCQYSQRPGTGCTHCIDVCPERAIRPAPKGGGLVIDHLNCTECGACISVCPTGALQYERFKDAFFYAFLKGIVKGAGPFGAPSTEKRENLGPKCLVIGDDDALFHIWWMRGLLNQELRGHIIFMEHPLPASLSMPQFLALAAIGLEKAIIVVDGASVKDASTQGLLVQIDSATNVTNALGLDFSIDVTSSEGAIDALNQLTILDPGQCDRGGRARPSWVPEIVTDGSGVLNKRVVMASILNHFFECGCEAVVDGMPQVLFRTKGHATHLFQDLELDVDACTHCLSCLNECRVGAFQAHEEEMGLGFQPILCIACGTCIDICPEGALKAIPGLRLDPYFLQERRLFIAEPAKCRGCGKVFGTMKSLERVKAILASKGQVDLRSLLDLCEDCRVRKMFETQD